MRKYRVWALLLLLPPLAAVMAFVIKALWAAAAAMVMPLLLVALLPFCHRRESIWLFVITAYTSVPVNVFLLLWFDGWMGLIVAESAGIIMRAVAFAAAVLTLSCIEQVILGMVGRIIWPVQYKLKYD